MNCVNDVIADIAGRLGLNLDGLCGVTIAHDYPSALLALDRGFQSDIPLTPTNNDAAQGCAMVVPVLRNGKSMSHLVLNSALLPTIDHPSFGVSGRYVIAHELSHVCENHWRREQIPNSSIGTVQRLTYPGVLFEIAESCWSEYSASYLSAPVSPEQIANYETILIDALPIIREQIVTALSKWTIDRNVGLAYTVVKREVRTLCSYISYLLGHAAGLEKEPAEIAPTAWNLLQQHRWLYASVVKLYVALDSMRETFGEWMSVEAFNPARDVASELLCECGVAVSLRPDDNVFVVINPQKTLPVYLNLRSSPVT